MAQYFILTNVLHDTNIVITDDWIENSAPALVNEMKREMYIKWAYFTAVLIGLSLIPTMLWLVIKIFNKRFFDLHKRLLNSTHRPYGIGATKNMILCRLLKAENYYYSIDVCDISGWWLSHTTTICTLPNSNAKHKNKMVTVLQWIS